jgi:ABC-type amino acid transport substrate-binding protein
MTGPEILWFFAGERAGKTFIEKKTFSVVTGTTAEAWLQERLKDFEIDATVAPVSSYEEGIQRVLNHGSDVLFGDRAVLLEAAKRSSSQAVADRLFTYEPIAIGLRRGDDDLRILVDRTLSQLYRSPEINKLYATWFGKTSLGSDIFYQLSALPD